MLCVTDQEHSLNQKKLSVFNHEHFRQGCDYNHHLFLRLPVLTVNYTRTDLTRLMTNRCKGQRRERERESTN